MDPAIGTASVMYVELRNCHDVVSAIEGSLGALAGSGVIWRDEVLVRSIEKTCQGGSCRTTCYGLIRALVVECRPIPPNMEQVCRSNVLTKALPISKVSLVDNIGLARSSLYAWICNNFTE
jgi:hypothetical protein